MTAWRHSKPQTEKLGQLTYMPRKHDPERAFWRGLSAVLPQIDATGGRDVAGSLPPALVRWLADALGDDSSVVVDLDAVGVAYGSNDSVIDDIHSDSLTIPAALLSPEHVALALAAKDAVEVADAAVQTLVNLVANLAVAAGSDDTSGARDRARERAYAALDPEFRGWVRTLTGDADEVDRARTWQRSVRAIVWRLAEAELSAAGPTATVGRMHQKRHVDVGQSEAWLRAALGKALPRAYERSEVHT